MADVGPPATGVLLAAGAGRRAGGPKALRRDLDGTSWLIRSVEVLLDGGCAGVVVVLGCQAAAARALLVNPPAGDVRVAVVEAPDWADGISRSLQAGLAAAAAAHPAAPVLVHLVDLPDVRSDVVRRLLAGAGSDRQALARATYAGRPGHPVLIGSGQVAPLLAGLAGRCGSSADVGAQSYLARHGAVGVECGDLATGEDRDGAG